METTEAKNFVLGRDGLNFQRHNDSIIFMLPILAATMVLSAFAKMFSYLFLRKRILLKKSGSYLRF